MGAIEEPGCAWAAAEDGPETRGGPPIGVEGPPLLPHPFGTGLRAYGGGEAGVRSRLEPLVVLAESVLAVLAERVATAVPRDAGTAAGAGRTMPRRGRRSSAIAAARSARIMGPSGVRLVMTGEVCH